MRTLDSTTAGGWLRVLCLLLTLWEPLSFAVVAANAIDAIRVRGASVALVLVARLLATALCVAAGRSLLAGRPSGVTLAKLALAVSAGVQSFALLTPYFPSNRMPGDTPLYVAAVIAYYGGWMLYLQRSKRVAATCA